MTTRDLETLIRLAKVDPETAERMRAVLELARKRQRESNRAWDARLVESLMGGEG